MTDQQLADAMAELSKTRVGLAGSGEWPLGIESKTFGILRTWGYLNKGGTLERGYKTDYTYVYPHRGRWALKSWPRSLIPDSRPETHPSLSPDETVEHILTNCLPECRMAYAMAFARHGWKGEDHEA